MVDGQAVDSDGQVVDGDGQAVDGDGQAVDGDALVSVKMREKERKKSSDMKPSMICTVDMYKIACI